MTLTYPQAEPLPGNRRDCRMWTAAGGLAQNCWSDPIESEGREFPRQWSNLRKRNRTVRIWTMQEIPCFNAEAEPWQVH